MKNIINVALVAATVLSLASCGDGDKSKKQPIDSTSTTVIDSNTKTTSVIDSTKTDTIKLAAHKTPGQKPDGSSVIASARAIRDSFKKDSAKMSRK